MEIRQFQHQEGIYVFFSLPLSSPLTGRFISSWEPEWSQETSRSIIGWYELRNFNCGVTKKCFYFNYWRCYHSSLLLPSSKKKQFFSLLVLCFNDSPEITISSRRKQAFIKSAAPCVQSGKYFSRKRHYAKTISLVLSQSHQLWIWCHAWAIFNHSQITREWPQSTSKPTNFNAKSLSNIDPGFDAVLKPLFTIVCVQLAL